MLISNRPSDGIGYTFADFPLTFYSFKQGKTYYILNI
jgi:hypothetical protein